MDNLDPQLQVYKRWQRNSLDFLRTPMLAKLLSIAILEQPLAENYLSSLEEKLPRNHIGLLKRFVWNFLFLWIHLFRHFTSSIATPFTAIFRNRSESRQKPKIMSLQ